MHSDQLEAVAFFIGAPNSGKTTLYNWITGSKFRTVNYPGATVDYSVGSSLDIYGEKFTVVDTPGIYSLIPKTPEEEVTEKVLYELAPQAKKSVVVVTVDATHFSRHMILSEQLKQAGFRVVIAITMSDILAKKSVSFDTYRLRQITGCPVVLVDGRLGGNIHNLAAEIREQLSGALTPSKANWSDANYKKMFTKYDKIREDITRTGQPTRLPRQEWDSKFEQNWDKIFLHPFFGLVIFLAFMFTLFSSIFWLATPLMDAVDKAFSFLIDSTLSLSPDSMWLDFLANGLIAAIGAFAVFIPQIAILFLGLTLLEDSGYMARAATLIDRPLRKIGLNGRSFVPLLSGFACAVPALMAARTIPNKKERYLTQLIIPLMTCSARLPVYALILAFLFHDQPAWIPGASMAALYISSIVIGGIASALLGRFLPKTADSFFALELPAYRRPVVRKVFKGVYERTLAFVKRAGPVIFAVSVVIWVGSSFPNYRAETESEKVTTSYAGKLGQAIEPIFEPMGADWRVGIGILTSFAAREVFVSTMAVVFNVAEEDDEATERSLLQRMGEAKFLTSENKGRPVFTFASCMALLVFYMIALQCMATVSVARREFGGWKMALIQLGVYNLLAYVAAVATYQLLI